MLGEMETRLATAALAVDDMIARAEGYDFAPSVGLAAAVLTRKTIAANHVIGAMEKALEAAGGAGFLRRSGLERTLRDVRGAPFHPLPEKRQQLFAGRLALGLDPVSGSVTGSVKGAT